MRHVSPGRGRAALAAISLSVLTIASASTGAASAAPVSTGKAQALHAKWARLTPLTSDIIDDVGLVRGSDGVLHVLWSTDGPGARRIMDSPVSASGAKLKQVTVATWFLTTDPDATLTKSGLAVFWNGITTNQSGSPTGTFEATRPHSGGSWSVSPGNVEPLTAIAFTSSSDTATAGSDGQPFVAFTGTDSLAVVHLGHPEVQLGPTSKCCVEQAGLATDGQTGTTWITYASVIGGHEGIFARPLTASGQPAGPARLLPGSVMHGLILQPHERVGTTGRGSAHPGVYALYEHGYPFATALYLTKLGTSSPRVVATLGHDASLINDTVTSDSTGQLYIAWVIDGGARLFIRRSNPSLTKFGPVEQVPLPAGSTSIWKVYLSAKAGHVDVLVLVTQHGNLNDTAYWHARVSPPLR